MSVHSTARMTLCLGRCRTSDLGHTIGLKSGDVLVGVGGRPWTGGIDKLKAELAASSGLVALSFARQDAIWTVLADRLDLGQWDQVPLPEGLGFKAFSPALLDNWEVVVDADGTHDIFAVRPSLFALLVPALWLAQQRLWTLLATLVAGLAVALPAGLPVVLVLWVAAGVHLWRGGAGHIRASRSAAGFYRVGVIAAQSEREAVQTWQTIRPNARFRFDPLPAASQAQTAG
ncbi:hypothetical protein [Pseudotabrizicola algicola]|uniref:PDZ domain-containing protein n=1 Tax=Pseudotabrizicola algicola TaxID=2709381 RepID=A0A6B3RGU0_9RHOB|nr:hypothetical protein [Pseudotabrizicola algicola]NEX45274.1 hypothetical protein [Pseudotabrizicola algicola]